jgi:hypothetical protein
VRALAGTDDDWRVYAPLGVGHHVDHLLAFDAGLLLADDGWPVSFYEDFPYTSSEEDYQCRRDELPEWAQDVVTFPFVCLTAKVDACGYYRSQVAAVFPGAEHFDEPIRRAAEVVATRAGDGGERYWTPRPAAGCRL